MSTSLLYNVLTGLTVSDKFNYSVCSTLVNQMINGGDNTTRGVIEWSSTKDVAGSLEKLKDLVNELIEAESSDITTEVMLEELNVLRALKAWNQGTAEEAAEFDEETSMKNLFTMLQSVGNYNISSCSDMHIAHSLDDTSIALSWTDPENSELNGYDLNTWKKTELWRVDGLDAPSVPGEGTNAVLLASTGEGGQNEKNYYKTHLFIDNTIQPGSLYTYKLFSYNSLDVSNNNTENIFPTTNSFSWSFTSLFSQAGILSSYASIGDLFTLDHSEYGTIMVRLVDFDGVTPTDSNIAHAAVFHTEESIYNNFWTSFSNLRYDSAEFKYALTQDTVVQSGKQYYTTTNSGNINNYSAASPAVGSTIPENTYYESVPWSNSASSNNRGNPNWSDSNIRQYFNFDDGPENGNWWSPMTIWDKCEYKHLKPFMQGLDPDLKSCLISVNRTEKRGSLWGGNTVTASDKIFIPFLGEINGETKMEEAKKRWAYYVSGEHWQKKFIDAFMSYYTATSDDLGRDNYCITTDQYGKTEKKSPHEPYSAVRHHVRVRHLINS